MTTPQDSLANPAESEFNLKHCPAARTEQPSENSTAFPYYNWNFKCEEGRVETIPLGVRVSKSIRHCSQPIHPSVKIIGPAKKLMNTPEPGWIFGLELTPFSTALWSIEKKCPREER